LLAGHGAYALIAGAVTLKGLRRWPKFASTTYGSNLRLWVERAAAGEEITIVRRGKKVARLGPPAPLAMDVPDLSKFRASIKLRGEPLSQTVIRQRREARY
jgi:antitoxin (DNA-binding transcriptional repressor) of toxin-antitoxin stability system